MAVHIGLLTSEVHTSAPGGRDASDDTELSMWERRARMAADLERVTRDRRRTATGHGDD
ncbi:MAG: hypothetical protein AAFY28_07565 [Actinomycetota bacterium]